MLDGKVAFITGSGAGIGRAEAVLFAERGADVVVHDVNADGADETAALVRAQGRRAHVIVADNADVKRMRAEIAAASATLGPIDILVNNAGISGRYLPLEEIDEATYERMFAVTVKGAFFCAQAVLPGMKARGGGKIINTSSDLAMTGSRVMSHYTASKTAMMGLTRAWAKELAPFRINVNCLVPGVTDTDMPSEEVKTRYAGVAPLGRIATPREIAYACAFLAGPEADFITGQVLSPSGGGAIVGM
ncbi:MAG: glucose 1-dehydrogenase [Alphaproteobacteria bacterium]|nr:glucose 1-dehydrogenase [Alphaproteobacteria bacterium]